MKWFQLDSDMPQDPRIQDVLLTQGNAGLGALLRLWCFIATHGRKRIGWSLDSRGQPIPRPVLLSATGLNSDEFELLLSTLAQNGHIIRQQWERKSVVAIPAMSKRGDTYSKRHVRSTFPPTSTNVPVQTSTNKQVQESKYSGAVAPRKTAVRKNGHDPYRTVLKLTHDVLGRIPIKEPVELASLKEDVKRQCAKYGIAYEGDVVGRAVESALAVRAKVGK